MASDPATITRKVKTALATAELPVYRTATRGCRTDAGASVWQVFIDTNDVDAAGRQAVATAITTEFANVAKVDASHNGFVTALFPFNEGAILNPMVRCFTEAHGTRVHKMTPECVDAHEATPAGPQPQVGHPLRCTD